MVEQQSKILSVSHQCRLLSVSRSSVYRVRAGVENDFNLEPMNEIDRQYLDMPFYGSRKMTAWLRLQGFPVNRKRVQRLMRKMGIEAICQKPNTSRPHPEHHIYP
jgi:putative transposase